MSRNRSFHVFLLTLAGLLLALAGCQNTGAPFAGTWVNQSGRTPYKYVYTKDGKIGGFLTDQMKEAGLVGRYSIESAVKDANGDTLYHVKERWSGPPYNDKLAATWYVLIKLAKDGKTFEHGASPTEYPSSLDWQPMGTGFHHIYVLQ